MPNSAIRVQRPSLTQSTTPPRLSLPHLIPQRSSIHHSPSIVFEICRFLFESKMADDSILRYLPPGWTEDRYKNASDDDYEALTEEVRY